MKTIDISEHVFIAGKTGSGKTFLAENYLAGYENVIALDTKGFIEWKQAGNVPIFDSLEELQHFKEGKAIYRPKPEEMDIKYYDLFFKWIYERQNCIVYIDELMSVCTATAIPFYLKAILTRGRQRKTSCWALTQRPRGIPLITISEATHFFIFDLQLEADRHRLTEVIPSELIEETPTQYSKRKNIYEPFLFWYYNTKLEDPILSKINIKKRG